MKGVGCNPCRKRFCKEMTCLEKITVEDVLEAARNLLAGPKERGQGGVVRAS
jgi:ADP-heptose:LPS heptosyltransferase